MKSTGIVRGIDALGRIVLPKELPVLPGDGKIRFDHPLGGDAAQAHHDLRLQQAELLPQGVSGSRCR